MSIAACIVKAPLTPYDLISFVSEEYEHHQLVINHTTNKVSNSAFTTDSRSCVGKGSMKAQLQEVLMLSAITAIAKDATNQIVGVLEVEDKAKGQNETHAEARRLRSRQQLLLLYPKSRRISHLHLHMCNQ
jgi:hypothetical protein